MGRDIEAVLAGLSIDQKAALTAGADTWRTTSVPEAGIPALKVTDGPVGARGDLTSGTTSTCFPCGAALGATWDVELAEAEGAELAAEARAKGAGVLLAPTVNLHRHPLAGRNFECFSEEPELSARIAAAYVRGLQAGGVGACIKHYVANDQEHERMTISSELDETTLRELYLRPFEAVVAEASPWSVMAAYNKVNGTYASEHDRLQNQILKQEWGWDGAIISDWYATHDTVAAATGGLDLQMPGPPAQLGPGRRGDPVAQRQAGNEHGSHRFVRKQQVLQPVEGQAGVAPHGSRAGAVRAAGQPAPQPGEYVGEHGSATLNEAGESAGSMVGFLPLP